MKRLFYVLVVVKSSEILDVGSSSTTDQSGITVSQDILNALASKLQKSEAVIPSAKVSKSSQHIHAAFGQRLEELKALNE